MPRRRYSSYSYCSRKPCSSCGFLPKPYDSTLTPGSKMLPGPSIDQFVTTEVAILAAEFGTFDMRKKSCSCVRCKSWVYLPRVDISKYSRRVTLVYESRQIDQSNSPLCRTRVSLALRGFALFIVSTGSVGEEHCIFTTHNDSDFSYIAANPLQHYRSEQRSSQDEPIQNQEQKQVSNIARHTGLFRNA